MLLARNPLYAKHNYTENMKKKISNDTLPLNCFVTIQINSIQSSIYLVSIFIKNVSEHTEE